MAGLADAARRLMFGLSETKRTAADLQSGLDAPSLENPFGVLSFCRGGCRFPMLRGWPPKHPSKVGRGAPSLENPSGFSPCAEEAVGF